MAVATDDSDNAHPPLVWKGELPYSPQYQDVYRNPGADGQGGLRQAKHVFLAACGLPQGWQQPRPAPIPWPAHHAELAPEQQPTQTQAHYSIIETGFGLGLNFLTTWAAWRADPRRCQTLYYTSIEAYPVQAQDIVRSAHVYHDAELNTLAQELASAWWGLTPGLHRLQLDNGRVQLTLCIGDVVEMLTQLQSQSQLQTGAKHSQKTEPRPGPNALYDAVYLDGFAPSRNPAMWSSEVLRLLSTLCYKGSVLASYTVARSVRDGLLAAGFSVSKKPGIHPKRSSLSAIFTGPKSPAHNGQAPGTDPAYSPASASPTRPASLLPPTPLRPGRCTIIGAGLAGAACARALAELGWEIDLCDAAPDVASGASGLPAGLFAPRISADDNAVSQITRAGIRVSLHHFRRFLQEGRDWAQSGILQRQTPAAQAHKFLALQAPHLRSFYADWSRFLADNTAPDTSSEPAPWLHLCAGWVRPASLVRAWIAHPNIRFYGGRSIDSPEQLEVAQKDCDLIVLCNAVAASKISPVPLPYLRPIRGQVSLGPHSALPEVASAGAHPGLFTPDARPINGDGHILPTFAHQSERGELGLDAPYWAIGATFERDLDHCTVDALSHQHNAQRLHRLAPEYSPALAPFFAEAAPALEGWAGVRCYTPDRLPLLGQIAPQVYICTGLGSRGLSLAALCAQLLVARLHALPLPIGANLARRLDVARFAR